MITLIQLAPLAIAIGAFAIGLAALVFPVKSSKGFGIEVDQKHSAYVRATGARDLFIGCIFLYFWLQKDFHSLAYVSFFTAIVSFSDFLITFKEGSKIKSFAHLTATVAVCILGTLLLTQ